MAKIELVTTGNPPSDPGAMPPALGAHGNAMWQQICSEWQVDDAASRLLLEMACRQHQLAEEISQRLGKDGLTIKTRAGVKTHPLIQAQISSRSFVSRALSKLGVLYEPTRAIGRPPGT